MNSAAFNDKDKTGNVLLARPALVKLCSAKPAFEMFAFASPQLVSLTNKGVTVPGKTWCGTAIFKKEANSPLGSKGLSP